MRRTDRADIFDNFTPDQAAEVAALIASMPGCKLTVRRSRRRPLARHNIPRGFLAWTALYPPIRIENVTVTYQPDAKPLEVHAPRGRVPGFIPMRRLDGRRH